MQKDYIQYIHYSRQLIFTLGLFGIILFSGAACFQAFQEKYWSKTSNEQQAMLQKPDSNPEQKDFDHDTFVHEHDDLTPDPDKKKGDIGEDPSDQVDKAANDEKPWGSAGYNPDRLLKGNDCSQDFAPPHSYSSHTSESSMDGGVHEAPNLKTPEQTLEQTDKQEPSHTLDGSPNLRENKDLMEHGGPEVVPAVPIDNIDLKEKKEEKEEEEKGGKKARQVVSAESNDQADIEEEVTTGSNNHMHIETEEAGTTQSNDHADIEKEAEESSSW
ncbi:hypothetical protein [Cardinium endosymbiont of Nabis limbatus]|uniref:hypothetical protein n=1 Tax=Cardinium endosymbiont of Nabis limbatus TaxID=3066217 RepID=UPI003AF3E324